MKVTFRIKGNGQTLEKTKLISKRESKSRKKKKNERKVNKKLFNTVRSGWQ
jgi:hypothetical protein